MLKERRLAADLVTSRFLAVEKAVDQASASAATCLATMLEQRAAANLPIATGADALTLVAEATSDLMLARRKLIDAHGALARTRDGIGLRGYGDQSECPPDVVQPMGRNPQAMTLVA